MQCFIILFIEVYNTVLAQYFVANEIRPKYKTISANLNTNAKFIPGWHSILNFTSHASCCIEKILLSNRVRGMCKHLLQMKNKSKTIFMCRENDSAS